MVVNKFDYFALTSEKTIIFKILRMVIGKVILSQI